MSNINDSFFDGQYKEIWRSAIPAELTIKEIDFIIPYFGLSAESKVLDVMCGYGRHAIALGKKGIPVIAVDNLQDYVDEIVNTSKAEKLPVQAFQENIISFQTVEKFDLAICMGNSLNFFDPVTVQQLLKNISNSIKPSGYLLINTWSLAEIAIKNFVSRTWNEVDKIKFLTYCEYLFQPTRMEFTSTIISPEGVQEEKKGIDYIYSVSEMETLLNNAGLHLKEIFSIPGRKKFSLGDPRAYIICQKK